MGYGKRERLKHQQSGLPVSGRRAQLFNDR